MLKSVSGYFETKKKVPLSTKPRGGGAKGLSGLSTKKELFFRLLVLESILKPALVDDVNTNLKLRYKNTFLPPPQFSVRFGIMFLLKVILFITYPANILSNSRRSISYPPG